MRPKICLDFDGTLHQNETLLELGRDCLAGKPNTDEKIARFEALTNGGISPQMKLPFHESLRERMNMISVTRKDIQRLVEKICGGLSPSFQAAYPYIEQNSGDYYVISAGFKEIIMPFLADSPIPESNVYANSLIFDRSGLVIGYDETNPLANDGGKGILIKSLKEKGILTEPVIMYGDGWNDYLAKEKGGADYFVASSEFVQRNWDNIAGVDGVAGNFQEFLILVERISGNRNGKRNLPLESVIAGVWG